jgi:hypothetical protein
MAIKKPDHVSSTERQEIIENKAAAAGMTPEKLAELMVLAEIMKSPSAIEQKKADQEVEYRKQNLQAQAEAENQKAANLEREQEYCAHRRDDGMLLFTGQVVGGKVALVRCLRCQKPYAWEASEEEKRQGLNFMDKHNQRAVNEDQLKAQEKAFPVDPKRLYALGMPKVAVRHEKYLAERTVSK